MKTFGLVGLRGLEPRTSSLSGKRSNRLSYSPSVAAAPAAHNPGPAEAHRRERLPHP